MIIECQYSGLDNKSIYNAQRSLAKDQGTVSDIFERLEDTLCVDTSSIKIVLGRSGSPIQESDDSKALLGNKGYSYGIYKDTDGKQVRKVYINYDEPHRQYYIVNLLLGLADVVSHQYFSEYISNGKWYKEDNIIKSGLATYIAVRLADEANKDICRQIICLKESSFDTIFNILNKNGHVPNYEFKLVDSLASASAVGERIRPNFMVTDISKDNVFISNLTRLQNLIEAAFITVLNKNKLKSEEYMGIIVQLKMVENLLED